MHIHTHTSHPILFERVATEVILRQPDFNSQEVANLLWAFACTGQLDIDLFTCLESKVIRLLPSCNAQEMANIAWSYSVANVAAPSLFNDDFIHACIKNMILQMKIYRNCINGNYGNVNLTNQMLLHCHHRFKRNVTMPLYQPNQQLLNYRRM